MNNTDKYFQLFGIKRISQFKSKAELISKYRQLALRYHPDKGGNPAHFRIVKNAFEYLKGIFEVHLRKEFVKFTNKNFYFYGDGSVYDIEKKKWLRMKDENGAWIILRYKYVKQLK